MRSISWGNIWSLVAAFAVGLACSYAVGFDPVTIRVDKDAGQIWPAWLQAAGAIFGLGIAIAVPNIIHAREQGLVRSEKRLREKSFMLAMLPAVQALSSQLRRARWAATKTDDPPEPADYHRASKLLDFPDELKQLRLQLHEAGPVSEKLYKALSMMPAIQEIFDYADLFEASDGMYWDDEAGNLVAMAEPRDFYAPIDEASRLLHEAIEEMKVGLVRN